jgi:hypothetical protein
MSRAVPVYEPPGEYEVTLQEQTLETPERAWFWRGFRWAGWALMAAYLAYQVAIAVINAGMSAWAVPDVVFGPLACIGLCLGPAWLAIAVVRVTIVGRRLKGQRGERVLLIGGLCILLWHMASFYLLLD